MILILFLIELLSEKYFLKLFRTNICNKKVIKNKIVKNIIRCIKLSLIVTKYKTKF